MECAVAKFLVSYDLVDGRDYGRIIAELDRLGAVRTQKSVYFTDVTTESASGFLQHLQRFVDADDRLMVIKILDKPAYMNALAGSNAWVNARFP